MGGIIRLENLEQILDKEDAKRIIYWEGPVADYAKNDQDTAKYVSDALNQMISISEKKGISYVLINEQIKEIGSIKKLLDEKKNLAGKFDLVIYSDPNSILDLDKANETAKALSHEYGFDQRIYFMINNKNNMVTKVNDYGMTTISGSGPCPF